MQEERKDGGGDDIGVESDILIHSSTCMFIVLFI